MAVASKVYITQNNTQDIKLFGLMDQDSGLFWTAATATANLYDQNGNLVQEVSNVPLNYIPNSLGNYLGTVTTDDSIAVGGGYRLVIEAAQGGSLYHIEVPCEVIVRVN